MHQEIVIALALIGAVAIFCQWFAWLVKLPAILFLLLAGVVLGPGIGWLHPDALFGQLLFPVVSLSVAIILFEGSLTLKFRDIAGLGKVVRNMLTIGVAVTWLITGLAVRYFLGFSWELSWLFGAIMVVTGPTVVVPMLRTVRPNAKIASILRWEGIVIDPIGAILAVLVFGFIISGQTQGQIGVGETFLIFGKILTVGTVLGAASGYGFGLLLRHHLMPEYLHNVSALTLVCATYALSDQLLHESGLLAVTVMGVWLANMKNISVEDILNFKESLSVLLISGLFIILAARIEFSAFTELGLGAVWVFLVMQFIARPLKVLVSTWRSAITWREKIIIGWIGPRGIVAAAVSALFAIRLQDAGIEQAALVVPLAFAVIIGTVVLQSTTAKYIADRLGVADPEDKGFLIIGANSVARSIAKALNENGFRTLLSDPGWENISAARMEGLDTYYGKAVSEHADRHLDLVGLGQLMALSPQQDLNTLACLRYRSEFGRNQCFVISSSKEKKNKDTHSRLTDNSQFQVLFGNGITFAKLASLLGQGASIKSTRLSDSFDYQAYIEKQGKKALPLFAVTPKGSLRFFSSTDLKPQKDWVIIAMVQPQEQKQSSIQGTSPVCVKDAQHL